MEPPPPGEVHHINQNPVTSTVTGKTKKKLTHFT